MSREALVLLVCCCDFRDGAERLIPSKSLRNAVIRAFPGLFRILRMCAPRRAAAVVRPRGREKSADRRRRILISRLLIIRASVPRRKSPFPSYFKGFPAVSPLIPPYPAFLKYPVSPHRIKREVDEPDHESINVLPHQRSMVASITLPLSVMTTSHVAVEPEKVSVGTTRIARNVAFAVMIIMKRTSSRAVDRFLVKNTSFHCS